MVWEGEKRDTGWIDITPDATNAPVSPNTPQWRICDGRLEFQGKIQKLSGSWTANSDVVLVSGANVDWPDDYWPPFSRDFISSGAFGSTPNFLACMVRLGTDGSLFVRIGASVPTNISLDAVWNRA